MIFLYERPLECFETITSIDENVLWAVEQLARTFYDTRKSTPTRLKLPTAKLKAHRTRKVRVRRFQWFMDCTRMTRMYVGVWPSHWLPNPEFVINVPLWLSVCLARIRLCSSMSFCAFCVKRLVNEFTLVSLVQIKIWWGWENNTGKCKTNTNKIYLKKKLKF